MKRCPKCSRTYADETLNFCLNDGEWLDGDDGPPTAILSEPRADADPASESLTRAQVHTTEKTAILPPDIGDVSKLNGFDKRLLLAPLALAAIVLGGFLGYRYLAPSKQVESIAVMPFVNDSGNPEVEYLSDGMTEALISSLSRLPDIKVKARSSVFRYKGKDTDPQTVGKELNVQAILNGRVVQRGQDLILNVELIDARTENVLWYENYSRQMANLVSLQNDIARDLSQKLKTKLSGIDEQKLSKNYTENAEAYQLYLKGRFHWNRRTENDLEQSAEYFRQAIASDPNYALAYAGLADVYAPTGVTVMGNPALRRERLARSREAALKAVSLDDGLAEAHTALGTVLVSADYDFAGAEREYRRAIELNPNYADAHYWYGTVLNRLGRWEESFAELRLAMELEPFNLIYRTIYGASLSWARRYEEGIQHLESTRKLDETFLPPIGNLTIAYELNDNYDRAIELRAVELDLVGFTKEAAELRSIYAEQGWDGYLRFVTSDHRPAWVSFYGMAIAHVRLGEKDKAIEALNKSYDNREGASQRLKVDPRLDPLRGDPRFRELAKRMNLQE